MQTQVAASNGLSNRISVVTRDVAKLQRGKDVRRRGVNLVVADMFDAGANARESDVCLCRA